MMAKKSPNISKIILAVVAAGLIGWLVFYYSARKDAGNLDDPIQNLGSYRLSELLENLENACGREIGCLLDGLQGITEKYGPEATLVLLENLQLSGYIPPRLTTTRSLTERVGKRQKFSALTWRPSCCARWRPTTVAVSTDILNTSWAGRALRRKLLTLYAVLLMSHFLQSSGFTAITE